MRSTVKKRSSMSNDILIYNLSTTMIESYETKIANKLE